MGERDRDRNGPQKKTWREIDAARDGARRERDRDERGGGGPGKASSSSAQYRAALDALFEKGGFDQMAEKLNGRFAPPAGAPKPAAPPGDAKPEAATVAPTPAPAAEKKDEARLVLRKKLIEALGREDITRAFDRWVKAYGMPRDFELLEQGLEHTKTARQAEVLTALDGALEREKPKRSRSLAGKLRFIEETSDDADLRAHAARIRTRLG